MLYHWCRAAEWEVSGDAYSAPSLASDGFIHCSYRHQVERTAGAVDAGRDDLVLLTIAPDGLSVIDEDCHEIGEEYPHVYGPIPRASVVAVTPFPPEADGTFRLPAGV